jgi:hypothetical protein
MASRANGKHSRDSILRAKERQRKKLANLSFAKKLEILDQLRERSVIMAAARKKK